MQISLAGRGMADFDASAFATKDEREMLYAISKLDLSRNKLTLTRGMQCLSNLTSLDVSNNKLKSLAGLPLKLRRLDASNNDLKFLDGLTPLSQLEWINVSGNELVSLNGLPGTATLHHVDASHNRLPNLKGLELCVGIHELRVSHNMLRKVDDLISLRYLRAIRHLTIGDNPVTSNPRNATAIRLLVPKITTLDGVGGGGLPDANSQAPGGPPLAPPATGQARVVVRSNSNPGSRPGTPTNLSGLSVSTIPNGGNSLLGGVTGDTSIRQQLRAVEASVRPNTGTTPTSKDALYLSLLRTLDSSKRPQPSSSPKRAHSADGAAVRRSTAADHSSSAISHDATAADSSAARRPLSASFVNSDRAPLDASVPALMSQRVMQQRIDDLERQLAATKTQLANAARDAENYKLQVQQLKETVERQAKINSLLADRNAEMTSTVAAAFAHPMPAAPRVSFSTGGVDGGSQQYVMHPSISAAQPATHRNSMTETPGERRSSSAQHRASIERNQSKSPVDRRSSTRPSPTRNGSPSHGGSGSGPAVKHAAASGYARRLPMPSDAPSAAVGGGGRKARLADSSPNRGTQVPTLKPQDGPSVTLQNYNAALAREASSTPRQQQQHASKNVRFGGSQFYSPPQAYFS
jgi:hypothetical protein